MSSIADLMVSHSKSPGSISSHPLSMTTHLDEKQSSSAAEKAASSERAAHVEQTLKAKEAMAKTWSQMIAKPWSGELRLAHRNSAPETSVNDSAGAAGPALANGHTSTIQSSEESTREGSLDKSASSQGTATDRTAEDLLTKANSSAAIVAGGTTSKLTNRPVADNNPPCSTLYIGGLPHSPPPGYPVSHLEDVLLKAFSKCEGYHRFSFKQKVAGPMCFVEVRFQRTSSPLPSSVFALVH